MMTSEKRLVQIPDGARVTVELNPDQVEAFVQVEIRRQVGEVVRLLDAELGR